MSFSHGGITKSFHSRVLFEIAVNNVKQLFAGLDIGGCSGKMRLHMVLDNFSQQTVHGSAATGDPLQHISAADLFFQRALDGLDLAPNAPDSVQQFRFLADRVAHDGRFEIG
jgi:hypothetical protein